MKLVECAERGSKTESGNIHLLGLLSGRKILGTETSYFYILSVQITLSSILETVKSFAIQSVKREERTKENKERIIYV